MKTWVSKIEIAVLAASKLPLTRQMRAQADGGR
jgi:hypothetical protein